MNRIDLIAPAKLNLVLRILGERPDGYHEIYSIMQAIDLCDDISFTRFEGEEIIIRCQDESVPTGDDNLIARAFRALKEMHSFSGGLDVGLIKRIPIGSGLGGGSSDCAATIRAVDKLFGLSQTKEDMSRVGAGIGSDIPFFFSSGSAIVTGRGEIVEDIDLPLDYSVVIVYPNVTVSTRDVYDNLRITLTRRVIADRFQVNRDQLSPVDLPYLLHNDLEDPAIRCCPEVRKAGEKLTARGFEHVSMSGSGSAMFAIVPNRGATRIESVTKGDWGRWRVFAARPIRLAGV